LLLISIKGADEKSRLWRGKVMIINRISLIPIAVLLLFALLFSTGKAQALSFAAAVNYGAGDRPTSIAAGDFNGDGHLDLAVANEFTDNVSILLGNGDGTFNTAVNYAAGDYPSSVAAGDFNGDGHLDLAVANYVSYNVSILIGNGDGTFNTAVNYAVGRYPYSVTAGDFNGDGHIDLAVANYRDTAGLVSDYVSILLGNGDGTFNAAVNYVPGSRPRSITTGDFNGDGHLDLAVANSNSDDVSILLGNGDGTFNAAVNYAAGDFPISVSTGDFNRDGYLDLAVANDVSQNVSILLGNGDGTFNAAVNYAAGGFLFSVSTGDFNGDGKQDLAVTLFSLDKVAILPGNGNGTFNAAVNFTVGDGPLAAATGDFNGDGRLDLATANNTSGNISILLNTTRAQTLTVIKTGSGSGSVSSNPEGINCGTDCEETYPDGTAVRLTATPDKGSTFAGWGGDCSGREECLLLLNDSKTVQALFNVSWGKIYLPLIVK
jgi:FG-GAP-like repeat/Divergent InlB B-repeat domain/FG-GAP repeat